MLSKKNLFDQIHAQLGDRMTLLLEEIQRLQESKAADTKSSAGDKFETGREMIGQELAKVEASLNQVKSQIQALSYFAELKPNKEVREGSMIQLGEKWFLLSVSLGEVKVGEESVFLLSKESPLGQSLLGKKIGDSVQFMGKPQRILQLR